MSARSALALSAVALTACGLNQQGVPPPRDRIVYPSSAFVDPDGHWMYVANSNSDLRYNSGTLVALDLDQVAADEAQAWDVCPKPDFVRSYDAPLDGVDDTADHVRRCCWDYLDHNVLDCDERAYVNEPSTIEIGSFAAGLVFQPSAPGGCTPGTRHACSQGCQDAADAGASADAGADAGVTADAGTLPGGGASVAGRLFVGIRGNSSIVYADTQSAGGKPALSCTPPLPPMSPTSTTSAKGCALSEEPDVKPVVNVPEEPYALYLDSAQDLLYVGHLRGDTAHQDTGGVSLFDVQGRPKFVHPSRAFFPADVSGSYGVTSLSYSDETKQLYATSRYVPMAVSLATSTNGDNACSEDLTMVTISPSSVSFTSPLAGSEMRGLKFVSPTRAFALQRIPPALIGYQLTNGPLGNVATDFVETCAAPTFLDMAGEGDARRLFVTCFEAGQVYVVDPTIPQVVATIDVGRGPAGLQFSPPGAGPARAYVIGFGHNNVGVIDLEPGSPTQYHVIHKLGFPSVLPR
ncbi:MAG TPA: hypothetical protein VHJ20_19020 [Polyangia bacterium]|nr:hypothetical protein [Polyangia bacterium]